MKNAIILALLVVATVACNSGNSVEKPESARWWTNYDKQLIISELNRTTKEIGTEIDKLTNEQLDFREENARWSIAEIIEHLEMQNQLHYREISVISKTPQYLQFRSVTDGRDDYFSNYANDTIKGKAKWFLAPLEGSVPKRMAKQLFIKPGEN